MHQTGGPKGAKHSIKGMQCAVRGSSSAPLKLISLRHSPCKHSSQHAQHMPHPTIVLPMSVSLQCGLFKVFISSRVSGCCLSGMLCPATLALPMSVSLQRGPTKVFISSRDIRDAS
eukprot:1157849-Pelagomonas_calceolata.AAC.14